MAATHQKISHRLNLHSHLIQSETLLTLIFDIAVDTFPRSFQHNLFVVGWEQLPFLPQTLVVHFLKICIRQDFISFDYLVTLLQNNIPMPCIFIWVVLEHDPPKLFFDFPYGVLEHF